MTLPCIAAGHPRHYANRPLLSEPGHYSQERTATIGAGRPGHYTQDFPAPERSGPGHYSQDFPVPQHSGPRGATPEDFPYQPSQLEGAPANRLGRGLAPLARGQRPPLSEAPYGSPFGRQEETGRSRKNRRPQPLFFLPRPLPRSFPLQDPPRAGGPLPPEAPPRLPAGRGPASGFRKTALYHCTEHLFVSAAPVGG